MLSNIMLNVTYMPFILNVIILTTIVEPMYFNKSQQ